MRTTIFICLFVLIAFTTKAQLLFGTTSGGGADGGGTISKFLVKDGALTNEKSFESIDNAPMYDKLVEAPDGLLYGVAGGGKHGSGILYSYYIPTGTYSKLMDFDYPLTGGNPIGGLMQARDGKFYGMTQYGGSAGQGVLY